MSKFLNTLDELFPLRLFAFALAALLFLWIAAPYAFAQSAAAPASTGLLDNVAGYIVDTGAALLAIAGAWLIKAITSAIVAALNITTEAKRQEVEDNARRLLHFTVENGLRWAFAKAGVSPTLTPSAEILADALFYTKSNSPDAASEAGDDAIKRIIVSKLHDLVSWYGIKPPAVLAVANSAPVG